MLTPETIAKALSCGQPRCTCGARSGDGFKTHCPAHSDPNPSLQLSEKNGKLLWKCFGGCTQETVRVALKERSLWPGKTGDGMSTPRKNKIIATYDYQDQAGRLIFQVCRMDPKSFRQRRPDGKGGWIWNLKGVAPVPYHLTELLKADTIYLPEGEEDVDRLRSLGLAATCNSGGAEKWKPDFNQHFKGKTVVILPDNDKPGRDHAQDVARNLHGVARSMRVVALPGLPEKGDVSDWLAAGGTAEKLVALVEAAPEWEPPAKPEPGAEAAKEKRPPQAELLLALATDAELFHDPDDRPYATIPVGGHRENWPIRSKRFKRWLLSRYYEAHGKAPNTQALHDALAVIEARAQFDGPGFEVYVRIAHMDNRIFADLANESWQAVEIAPSGWQVVADPRVKFRRPKGMRPLPLPEPGGSLDDLKEFLNVGSQDWPLVGAWVIGCFSEGPYPILIFQGEQGAAKSTAAKVLKEIVDPSLPKLRAIPREEADLLISAFNSWVLVFDNLSTIPKWFSNSLCRLSTGGGVGKRELYTDAEETILDVMRPIILNGIAALIHPGGQDLASRALVVELDQIQDGDRQAERPFWRRFEKAYPRILGAILDAVAAALANRDRIDLHPLPRMADFAVWSVAAEPTLPWEPGAFMAAYAGNRAEVVERSLAADVVGAAVLEFMESRLEWTGTPTALLEALEAIVPERTLKSRAWPKAAHVLTARLKRAATFLRAVGVEVDTGKSGTRRTTIRKNRQNNVQSAQSAQTQDSCEDSPGAFMDASPDLDASSAQPDASQDGASRKENKEINDIDAQDASDAIFATLSISEEDDYLGGEV